MVGDKEVENSTVTVRAANKVLGAKPVQEVIDSLVEEYQSRSSRKSEI